MQKSLLMMPGSDSSSLPPEFQAIANEAIIYVKEHRKEIIRRFAGEDFPTSKNPISIFMAGSPGAGKTEYSKILLNILQEDWGVSKTVRIDADEIRSTLPHYAGSNAYLFQAAASIGVDKIHDYVLKKRKNFILDGTFSNKEIARSNISRSLCRDRRIIIVYIYQDPIIAWKFTKMREAKEGRRIPRDSFIDQFFSAGEVVQSMKGEFGEKIAIWLVEKNLETKKENIRINIDRIDSHLSNAYSRSQLESILSL